MVSLRRRRLLGLCSGKSSTSVQLPRASENGIFVENPYQNVKSVSVHPLPSLNFSEQKQVNISEANRGFSHESGSSSTKDDPTQQYPVPEVKRRKRHRRKHFENQEPCIMRGVYFKNNKWQAAIKVDKKQIHLGTVGSQEEAARLYDRAAFMCGREPNFELSEEEKQELSQFKWDDFLTMTRNAISNKKHQRRIIAGAPRKSGTQGRKDWKHERGVKESSASEDIDGFASAL